MTNFFKWMLPTVAAVGLLLSVRTATAQDAPAGKGSVTGTVLDKEGKAVAGAEVRLMKPMQRGGGGVGSAAKPQAADAGQRQRPEPLAKATTDNDGKFTMKDVPAGKYMVMTRVDGKGAAYQPVTVTADQPATVTLNLKDMPARGGPGGGAGGGNRGGRGGQAQ